MASVFYIYILENKLPVIEAYKQNRKEMIRENEIS